MSVQSQASKSPFHAGEQHAQDIMGVRDIEDWAQKVIRPYMPNQHREFFTSLPFIVAASLDNQNRPWVTLLTGKGKFIDSPDPGTLIINTTALKGDPIEESLRKRIDLGLLGIELSSRRRNRVNGHITANDNGRLKFKVDQSFGNCPQYIRERNWTRVQEFPDGSNIRYAKLTNAQQEWISKADTFFIASGYRGRGKSPTYGMDASHRGGEPGFVQVVSKNLIRFPDFAGNNHFNTVGNLMMNPRAGFLFVDFLSGSLLHLTGTTNIDWDSDLAAGIPGARRIISLNIEEIVERRNAVPLRWDKTADYARSIRLIEKKVESNDITSFAFESRDGSPLPEFDAGQYLPIELDIPGIEGKVSRTYSLSGSPGWESYRISVKRESHGLASRYLHDHLKVGAIINSRKPAGDLVLSQDSSPVVLISAGVGLTPMVSMFHSLANEHLGRPVWFFHGARNGAYHAMADEIRQLSKVRPGLHIHYAYSRPQDRDLPGRDFDSRGRITGDLVTGLVNNQEAHYFICGPTGFMNQIQSALELSGIHPEKIHTESFGPSG